MNKKHALKWHTAQGKYCEVSLLLCITQCQTPSTHPQCTQSFSSIIWLFISVLTCILTPINWKHIQSSNRQWCWGFNPNYCWGRWDFKFIVPWSAFAVIWCNEVSSRWHTKCPYRVQRPALKVNMYQEKYSRKYSMFWNIIPLFLEVQYKILDSPQKKTF